MKNGDMPANVLVSSTGVLWNLRDGHEDSQYLGQPNERFSFGMTKREQFAMAAMQGLLTNRNGILQPRNAHDVAFLAVELAEALLEQLEKQK